MLVCLAGCISKNESESTEKIVIDLESRDYNEGKTAFHSFRYVALESTPESMLSDVSKVVTGNNRIFVLPMMDARIFIFSSDGKYINSLQKGIGPGEVTFVSDMVCNNNKLYVLDNYRTIHEYDLDGNYIQDVYKSDKPFFSFQYIDDGLWTFDSNVNKHTDYYLQKYSDGKEYHYLAKPDNIKKTVFLHYNFYNAGLISWPISNIIYRIESNVPAPKYTISFKGENFFDLKHEEPFSTNELCELSQDKSYFRWIKDVAPYKSGIYFAFKYDKTYYVKYEKGKASIYSKLISGLPDIDVASVGHTEHEMIYAFPMTDLMSYKGDKLSDNRVESLYDDVKNEEDNPILIFVDLNE